MGRAQAQTRTPHMIQAQCRRFNKRLSHWLVLNYRILNQPMEILQRDGSLRQLNIFKDSRFHTTQIVQTKVLTIHKRLSNWTWKILKTEVYITVMLTIFHVILLLDPKHFMNWIYLKNKNCSTYKSEVLSIKLACSCEHDGSGRHVQTHRKGLGSKQSFNQTFRKQNFNGFFQYRQQT